MGCVVSKIKDKKINNLKSQKLYAINILTQLLLNIISRLKYIFKVDSYIIALLVNFRDQSKQRLRKWNIYRPILLIVSSLILKLSIGKSKIVFFSKKSLNKYRKHSFCASPTES